MIKRDDDELVSEAQSGNRQAFAGLLERHYGLMFKVAYQWCGVREDAEDIAQDASIKLAQNISGFMFESAFTTWLYRLVINCAKDYYKAKNRRNSRETPMYEDAVYISEDLTPEQKLSHKDTLKAISDLPETLRETVVLVCWQGMTHAEASDVLDCEEGTISWRIHEARKKIAETLEIKKVKRHG
ncbi:MAG: RNA polymerase sigma factor [Alphaproteobacteria bacterium]|nr:RNA polymerase sigma factor [Alphaproteobacteria bacterium]